MLWFSLALGVAAIGGIGICRHLAHHTSAGSACLGHPSDGEDIFDDDMRYDPAYDHLPCNVWHNSFESSGMASSYIDDDPLLFGYNDDWPSTSMFDDDSFGCSSFDEGFGCGASWDD